MKQKLSLFDIVGGPMDGSRLREDVVKAYVQRDLKAHRWRILFHRIDREELLAHYGGATAWVDDVPKPRPEPLSRKIIEYPTAKPTALEAKFGRSPHSASDS